MIFDSERQPTRIRALLIRAVCAIITLYLVVVIHAVQYGRASLIINMKASTLFTLLVIHTTTATIDLQKLKDTAATKLQTITDTASSSIKQFADTIDFEKVQKLDILNLIPKLQYKGKLIKDTYESLPEYGEKVRMYFEQIKGIKGQDLALAFEAPWPAKRRVYEEGYY